MEQKNIFGCSITNSSEKNYFKDLRFTQEYRICILVFHEKIQNSFTNLGYFFSNIRFLMLNSA